MAVARYTFWPPGFWFPNLWPKILWPDLTPSYWRSYGVTLYPTLDPIPAPGGDEYTFGTVIVGPPGSVVPPGAP